LDDAVEKVEKTIEARKKSYAFPWQPTSLVRACMLLHNSWGDEVKVIHAVP
jgi:hypothetical protein